MRQNQELRELVVDRDLFRSECEELKRKCVELTRECDKAQRSLGEEVSRNGQLGSRVSSLEQSERRAEELEKVLAGEREGRRQLLAQRDQLGLQLKSVTMKA